jgi:hypothetical protein
VAPQDGQRGGQHPLCFTARKLSRGFDRCQPTKRCFDRGFRRL